MDIKIFNTTVEQLEKNKHSVFIGISVGVKPMSEQIALSYMEWAEEHSTGIIPILIADKIARFNYLAFSHYTKPGSLSRAIRDGDKYQVFFDDVFKNLSINRRQRFKIIKWESIESPRFFICLKRVTEEFHKNIDFKKSVLAYAEKYIERRNKTISEEKKLFLGQYILHELAVLLDGIYMDDKNYNLIVYPTYRDSGMSGLISDIQTGIKFPSLKKDLNLKKTIMAEFIIP
ncbi:MAG: tRNA-dependent cyclodipeptide synthase [Gammaproteobacteria bacterium]|jgi:tRNA-dependent cyclodipeptide synthase